MLKKTLLVVLIVLIIIQFIHPAKNISTGEQPNNISKLHEVPTDVKAILVKACLDCHSNNTRYLWYFKIQPVDWWLTSHINGGKEELDFDEFANKPVRYQYNKLLGVVKMIKNKKMPLDSYLWIHKDAILTDAEKNTVINWAQAITDDMKSKYPADSLARKPAPGK